MNRYEVVEGCDLRHGDIILYECTSDGVPGSSWGGTRVERHNGLICWWDDGNWSGSAPRWNPDKRFSKGNFFRVVSPRAEPEINEFGPVSP